MASGVQMNNRAEKLVRLLSKQSIGYNFKTRFEELPDFHEIEVSSGNIYIYNTNPIAFQFNDTNTQDKLNYGNVKDEYKFREDEIENLLSALKKHLK